MTKGEIRNQSSILTAKAVGGIAETYGIDLGVIATARSSKRVTLPPKG